jgi:hypothetical protein
MRELTADGQNRADGRGQKADGRRQKAKGRRQKAKGKRQKAEGRRGGRFLPLSAYCLLPAAFR